jgi:hypothetical protein
MMYEVDSPYTATGGKGTACLAPTTLAAVVVASRSGRGVCNTPLHDEIIKR